MIGFIVGALLGIVAGWILCLKFSSKVKAAADQVL